MQHRHPQLRSPPPPPRELSRPASARSGNSNAQSFQRKQRDSVFDRLHDPANYTGVYQERFRSGPGINQHSDAVISGSGMKQKNPYGEAIVSDISEITRPNLRFSRQPSSRDIAKERMNDEYSQRMAEVLQADRKQASRRSRKKEKEALTESFTREAETMLRSLPQEPFDTDSQLQLIFQYYCRFGRTGGKGEDEDTMDNANFAKFCRECPNLLDKRLNITEVDIIFAKCKQKRARRLRYSEFLDALAALAQVKFPRLEPISSFSILLSRYVFSCPAAIGIHALTEDYVNSNNQDFSFGMYSDDSSDSAAVHQYEQFDASKTDEKTDSDAYYMNYGYGYGLSSFAALERPSISGGIISGDAAPVLSPPPPGTPRRSNEGKSNFEQPSFNGRKDPVKYEAVQAPPPPPAFNSPNSAALEQYTRARERYMHSHKSQQSRRESVRSSGSHHSIRSSSSSRKGSRGGAYSLGGAGVPTPRMNGSGSLRRPSNAHMSHKSGGGSVRSPSSLGTQEFVPTVAGEANRPGSVYDRLSTPASFTGVYKRAYLTDGRINHFADTGQSAVPSEYVGDTNTNSDESIHDIRFLLRPNLKTGPSFK